MALKSKLKASFDQEEIELMTRVMEEVVAVKIDKLVTQESIDGFYAYMLKFLEQLDSNEFNMTKANNNTCTWLKDQIKWSGVDKKGPVTKEAQRLLKVLDEAIDARKCFKNPSNNYTDLFE